MYHVFTTQSALSKLSALRTLRLVRVARVVRVIRLMRFFRSLRALVEAILNTVKSCLWAGLMLCMIMYMFGIAFAQAVADHIDGIDPMQMDDYHHTDLLIQYFGTLPRSIFTCFKSVQGGIDWEVAVLALSDVGAFQIALFIALIVFVNLAVLNVISGLFLQSAIEQAQQDLDDVITAHLQGQCTYVSRFKAVFDDMDVNHDGKLSLSEFEGALEKKSMNDLLQAMEIEGPDAWTLFKLLDADSGGSVDVDEFVTGCLNLKGTAKAIHLAQQRYESRWMMNAFEDLASFTEKAFNKFGEHINVAVPQPDCTDMGRVLEKMPKSATGNLLTAYKDPTGNLLT